jgi:hypothetical protein
MKGDFALGSDGFELQLMGLLAHHVKLNLLLPCRHFWKIDTIPFEHFVLIIHGEWGLPRRVLPTHFDVAIESSFFRKNSLFLFTFLYP